MLSETNFRKIVRASAWYDLLVTAPFGTPWSLALALDFFERAHTVLGASGEVPPLSTGLVFFANLLGSVVIVWSLVRIRSPEPWLGRFDALGRGLFSIWMLYAMLHGASGALLIFFIVEVSWGVAQILPYRPARIAMASR